MNCFSSGGVGAHETFPRVKSLKQEHGNKQHLR